MAAIADHLMSSDGIINAEYDKHSACVVRTAGELHEKLLRALHRHDTLSIDTGDLSEFVRLFADDLKELIDEASSEARELLDKAEKWDEVEDEIDDLRAANDRCEELTSVLQGVAYSVSDYS